jgi:large subunit ribosomal protein L30
LVKLAVVKVRGDVGARQDMRDTLRMLGLTRVNHCVLIDDSPTYKGMLQKTKDLITWGEVSKETIDAILRKRGRLVGDKKLTDEYFKSNTQFPSIGEFVDAIYSGKVEPSAVPALKKVFRLHPPRKGYEAIKRPFRDMGSLGYRGKKINDLLARMI